MSDKQTPKPAKPGFQHTVAAWVLGGCFALLFILVTLSVARHPYDVMDVVNTFLPLIASWVGTILAYYFGRENFNAANAQMREMVKRLSPDERAGSSIASIMRHFGEVVSLTIPDGKTEHDIKIADIREKLAGDISRVLIVDSKNVAKYMIHDSSTDRYLADGASADDTLQAFLEKETEIGRKYGVGAGFVVVAERLSIHEAKVRMLAVPKCQDIIVTANGNADEGVAGWVSNVRLAKFLEV